MGRFAQRRYTSSFLFFIACGGTGLSLTLDEALDRIDAAGRDSAPLTIDSLSEALGARLALGENHPGHPFEKVQVLRSPTGRLEAQFTFEASVCFTEAAARDRYGHLFANVGHGSWDGTEWVAQPEGYRLTLGMDPKGCVRRLGLRAGG